MKILSVYRVELRRLVFSKSVWVIAVLSLCTPMFGYSLFKQVDSDTMTSQYIADPVLAGTTIAGILWALLVLLESDRVYRAKADVLIDAMISPLRIAFARLLALITCSTVTTLACALVYLPYTVYKINYLFDFGLYIGSFLIMMMPTLWISMLLASALYQIARRIELAGLLYAGCVYFSFSPYMRTNYFAHWLNPIVVSYSDGFSNALILRISLYTRVLWVVLAAGIWAFSLLCIRRYQKKLPGSFIRSLRKPCLPVVSVVLICAGVMLWVGQPFVNHAPYKWKFDDNYGSISNTYAASSATYRLIANQSGIVSGTADYTISKNDNLQDSIWLDPGYQIDSVTCGGKKLLYHTLNNDVDEWRQTTFTIPRGAQEHLVIQYKGMPQMLRSFLPVSWDNTSSADYVSLNNAASVPIRTSFILPSSCKIELTLPGKLTPLIDHQLATVSVKNNDGTRTWKMTDEQGSSSIWITACDYSSVRFKAADTTINLLYSKKYDQNIKKYNIPQEISDVMNYCTAHLGPLKFVSNGQLMMVQRACSINEGGGNAGNGWVEWGEEVFTQNNLSNPLKGAKSAEVFAHEIIHEWWGGLGVMSKDDNLWSDEGLDVYTTYRLMEKKKGKLYAQQNYVNKWQTAVDEQERSYYNRHPEALKKLPEQYQEQLKRESQDTNLYCRMPLMILKAQQLIGGEAKMDAILQSIQQQYSGFGRWFSYQDFLDACGLKASDLNVK